MTWEGFILRVGKRKAEIRRSHGNWLALVWDSRGKLSSGEYFPYGQPGSLPLAKQWCERRLQAKQRRNPTGDPQPGAA